MRNKFGWTPLHAAAIDHVRVVELLLKYGTQRNAIDKRAGRLKTSPIDAYGIAVTLFCSPSTHSYGGGRSNLRQRGGGGPPEA
ncbi:ankyrin repeat domain-containing protein [Pyrobaculum sp.]|uniref:ankyrin repeat domain-containing protein n=1 Tax=Pyrobaculum sp. TaxID=2004705 RepID=UPI003D0C3A59